MTEKTGMLLYEQFGIEGYVIVRGLYNKDEIQEIRDSFKEVDFNEIKRLGTDVFNSYPRVMEPHLTNQVAFKYMIHPKVSSILEELFQEEPLACHTMFYYKPPGALGQALHQDNFYLKMEPEPCIGIWVALDEADEENGALVIVPTSHRTPIQCPHLSDPNYSFTKEEVDIPKGMQVMTVKMNVGDAIFFSGNIIHGSYPNRTKDRFRRAFITHYAASSTKRAGNIYSSMYTMKGEKVKIDHSIAAGPCGNEYGP